MDLITRRAGDAAVELAPEVGGSVTRYWIERGPVTREWLRPTPAGALRAGHPYLAAAYPLVPYSNRIRAGRFTFRGRSVVEPLNRPPERHAIHGHGWQARWQPAEVTAATARLEYRHPAGAWPWAYHATQRFTLTPSGLTVELSLSNHSAAPMPAGLGWHPYFSRTRRVTIDWPELGARLVMRATPPLDYLVVFTPARRPFFCVEPVSHVTDAFNLAEAGRSDSGTLVLEPGETLRTAVVLTPEL
jgi:aldose 1-epimerase